MAQRPSWFRFSSVMRPVAPAPGPPPAPAPNPPPPAPIQTLMRPSFQIRPPLPSTQNQDPTPPPPPQSFPAPPRSLVRTPAPPPRSSTPVPSVAPVRPPIVGPTPTEVPPRSPVVTPLPAPAPAPPQPAVAPPRSLVTTPSRNAATPPSPPAAPRSPIMSAPSPPKAATRQNSISPKFPESSPSVPDSPKTKTQSSPMPNSPISKSVSTNSPKVANLNGKGTSPNLKPDIPSERTPAPSPKVKPLARSPPPLKLPPAQINESEPKIEQKTVLFQESIDKPNKTHIPHNSAIPSNVKREQIKHDKGASANKKLSDSQRSGMRMITLVGENRGAVMQLSPSNRKNVSIGNPHTLNNSNAKAGSSSDDQLSSESGEEGKSTNRNKVKSPPMSAYLNSNVQGVNNSILYNFTSSDNDPGVHLSLDRKANGNRYFKK